MGCGTSQAGVPQASGRRVLRVVPEELAEEVMEEMADEEQRTRVKKKKATDVGYSSSEGAEVGLQAPMERSESKATPKASERRKGSKVSERRRESKESKASKKSLRRQDSEVSASQASGWTQISKATSIEEDEDTKVAKMSPPQRAKYILSSGSVRLLSAMWLLRRGEAYVIQRMQDLPEEAFLEPKHAADLFDKEYAVVAISYGWVSRQHPDPEGYYMRYIQRYLKKHKARLDGHRQWGTGPDYGVFWDFATLPQDQPDGTEKTEQEKLVLEKGLGVVGFLYGHKKTLVLQLSRVPEELNLPSDLEGNPIPYGLRGWCLYEATVSGLQKSATKLINLSAGTAVLDREDSTWDEVRRAATAQRQPPLTPGDMALELRRRSFTKGSDEALVHKMYTEFFEQVATSTEVLSFAQTVGPSWGDREATLLARALPAFTACQELYLQGHAALGEESLRRLRGAIAELPALELLALPEHLMDTGQGKALQKEWLAAGKKMQGGGNPFAGLRWA